MLTLPLLLSTAAGVNAVLGGRVSAIKTSDKSFFCTENCVFDGIYFDQRGYYCPEKEVISKMDAKGDIDRYLPFDCTGAKLPLGFSERQRFNGEEPPKYDILDSKNSKPNVCASYNIRGGKAGETVQWLDVAKEPKLTTSADGQATAQENQPAALRLQQQCADNGRLIFFACRRKSGEVDKCYQQFREAFENCLGVSARSPTETTLRTA
ncbi:hypothetical protein BBAD15_g11212 [Beauveria bassiana D1-5]|uniref:Uncharacterized protein n=1 Tax=Beauveria bassiana D1-5 TaxID=1245745 RepID=A0A0A2V6T4_BEABA|nr:hypothetical protein BBAD15_g11212 [Beauveria bassiana D1-5]